MGRRAGIGLLAAAALLAVPSLVIAAPAPAGAGAAPGTKEEPPPVAEATKAEDTKAQEQSEGAAAAAEASTAQAAQEKPPILPVPAAVLAPEQAKKAEPKEEGSKKEEPKPDAEKVPESGFFFGSYGRVVAGTHPDLSAPRDPDIVWMGSRLDEGTWVQFDVQRQDYWKEAGATTRVVALLGIQGPLFHQHNEWSLKLAARNLFVEEKDLLVKGLSIWLGSRMYRGDYLQLVAFWPLDWVDTVGGGARYDLPSNKTFFAIHAGLAEPNTLFFKQTLDVPMPLNQIATVPATILDRQYLIASAKASHTIPIGKGNIRGVLYGETHQLPAGLRVTDEGVQQALPRDSGYVLGAQLSGTTGENKSFGHLMFRYANGLAAGTIFAGRPRPSGFAPDGTMAGAYDWHLFWGMNYEVGPIGLMFDGYVRSFRNAIPGNDFGDLDEGIAIFRPHFFINDWVGVAVEGSYQAQRRLATQAAAAAPGEPLPPPGGPHFASVARLAFMPFLTPAGKGNLSLPRFRLIYSMARRDEGAKALYPTEDVYSQRNWEHYIGMHIEWFFKANTAFPN